MKWFSNLNMKYKFAILTATALSLVTFIAFESMDRLDRSGTEITQEAIPLLMDSKEVLQLVTMAKENEASYAKSLDDTYISIFKEDMIEAKKVLAKIKKNSLASKYSDDIDTLTQNIDNFSGKFHELTSLITELGREKTGLIGEFRKATHAAESKIKEANNADLYVLLLLMRRYEKDFLLRENDKYVKRLNNTVEKFKEEVHNHNVDASLINAILSDLAVYKKLFNEVATKKHSIHDKKEALLSSLQGVESEVQNIAFGAEKTVEKLNLKFDETIKNSKLILLGLSGLLVLIVSFLCAQIANAIIKKIQKSVTNLVQLSKETAAESQELNAQASKLNSASIEQAAATQQTSASMAEMESMISSTAEEATSGYDNIQEISQISEESERSAGELKISMNELLQSKEDLEKVLDVIRSVSEKTEMINDIVFKTQLLSFNASIEAARAGEHGRGFSVVAEEIAQLANTSGSAAKEIEQLTSQGVSQVQSVVESVSGKVDNGTQVSEQLMENFSKLRQNMSSTLESIDGITNATNEQKTGITQTNEAIGQMDTTITQFTTSASTISMTAEKLDQFNKSIASEVLNIEATIQGKHHERQSSSHNFSGDKLNSLVSKMKDKRNLDVSDEAIQIASIHDDEDEISAEHFDKTSSF